MRILLATAYMLASASSVSAQGFPGTITGDISPTFGPNDTSRAVPQNNGVAALIAGPTIGDRTREIMGPTIEQPPTQVFSLGGDMTRTYATSSALPGGDLTRVSPPQ